MNPCPYCSLIHVSCICPLVKSIEYNVDGTIKKIEFKEDPPIDVKRETGKFWRTKEER